MTTPTVLLVAPTGVSQGSIVQYPDGTTDVVNSSGQISCPAPFIAVLLNAGWQYVSSTSAQTSSALSTGVSAGLADSVTRSDAVSAGLSESSSLSTGVSAGLADSQTRSQSSSTGLSNSIARSAITSGSV